METIVFRDAIETFKVAMPVKGKAQEFDVPVKVKHYKNFDENWHSEHIDFTYPCLDGTGTNPESLELVNMPMQIQNHVKNCTACKIVLGISKATLLNSYEVVRLFAIGVTNKKSSSEVSEDNVLRFHRDLHAIRNFAGQIIVNSQCQSVGSFMSVSRPHRIDNAIRLPLDTISSAFFPSVWREELRDKLAQIEILDSADIEKEFVYNAVLFNVYGRTHNPDNTKNMDTDQHITVLYGLDTNNRDLNEFLAQVPTGTKTVMDAIEFLKPELVKLAEREQYTVKRHGDLYFIEIPKTEVIAHDVIKAKYVEKEITDYSYQYMTESNPEGTYKRIRQFLETPKILKVFGTRHRVTAIANMADPHRVFGNLPIVKGTVRHEGRQHRMLRLGENWHIPVQNNALNSWQVERAGRANRD